MNRGHIKTLDEIIMDAIMAAMQRNNWNRTHAADELNMCLRTMRNWLNKPEARGRFKPRTRMCCRHVLRANKQYPIVAVIEPVIERDLRPPEKVFCMLCGKSSATPLNDKHHCLRCSAPPKRDNLKWDPAMTTRALCQHCKSPLDQVLFRCIKKCYANRNEPDTPFSDGKGAKVSTKDG